MRGYISLCRYEEGIVNQPVYTASGSDWNSADEGRYPRNTRGQSGRTRTVSMMKQMNTTKTCKVVDRPCPYLEKWRTRSMMMNSKALAGFPRFAVGSERRRKTNTSSAVMTTPAHNGRDGMRRQNPIAEPNSSARSVEMIAISART